MIDSKKEEFHRRPLFIENKTVSENELIAIRNFFPTFLFYVKIT